MWTRIQSSYFLLQFIVVFTIALLVGAEQTRAQCTQKLSLLPPAAELYGFRLGMTKEQVKVLIPQTKFGKTDDFGVAKTTINPSFDPTISQERFEGVRSISLDFLDDRLTSLWIGFDETYKVHSVDEFVKQITASLQLAGTWTPWRSRGQQLRCDGFEVIVSALAGGPSVRLVDYSAEDTVASRRLAKEEEKEAAESAEPDGPAGAAAEPEEIIADRNSKTYFSPGCKPAKAIEEKNRVVFKNVEEAQKSGFKLARNCH